MSQSSPVIILVAPQLGENIGMTARAMANFGLKALRLVTPRDGWPNERAVVAASGAPDILENALVFDSVEEAIADLQFVVATTARSRDMVKPVSGPKAMVAELNRRGHEGQMTGILFGREKWGLTNDETALADHILTYPVNPDFSSLNLAQAVLLLGYEWYAASSEGREVSAGVPDHPTRKPATRQDLVRFFVHLETELDESGFLLPIEKRPSMVRNIRNIFHRTELTDQDVRTLRGIIVSLTRKFGGNRK
ncbi:MAG: RNA methyltransferase [Rhizobiales bacterium]|nr:RNA methyltransferase [Hyphomicrobiales bacterium]